MRRALLAAGLVLGIGAAALFFMRSTGGSDGGPAHGSPSAPSRVEAMPLASERPSSSPSAASGSGPADLAWPPAEGERGPDVPLELAEPLTQANVEIAALDGRIAIARASNADPAAIGALEAERAEAVRRRDALRSPEAGPSPH